MKVIVVKPLKISEVSRGEIQKVDTELNISDSAAEIFERRGYIKKVETKQAKQIEVKDAEIVKPKAKTSKKK